MPPPPGSSRRIASRGGTVCRPLGRMGRPERSATAPDAPARPPSRPRAGLCTRSKLHSSATGAAPVALLCNFERVHNPARGRDGGHAGASGTVALRSGRPIRPKGRQTVPPRDAICLELPGGGGIGDPRTRDPQRVLDDVRDGFISAQQARRDYGVVVDADGRLDLAATERLRTSDGSAADTL